MKWGWVGCSLLLLTACVAEEVSGDDCVAYEEGAEIARSQRGPLTRRDSLPASTFEHVTDPYLEGYIQALVDMHYYEFKVLVSVKDHKVYLSNLPTNEMIANSIIAFVCDLPLVRSVEVKECFSEEETIARKRYVEKPQVDGVWFPQLTVLFPPLVADPRQPIYSVAYRFGDRVIGKEAAAVSLGDEFPIFRWRDKMRWHGDLQIGIEAAVWAVFSYDNPLCQTKSEFCEMVNADYYVGIPLSYAFDNWAFRLRVYHISSHLGDECLVNYPDWICHRKNPSMEAVDFFTSYQFAGAIRAYVGPGVVVHSDKTFPIKPLYVQWGVEVRVLGRRLYYQNLYGTPFFAMHMENWEQRHWDLDATFKLGYEWSKLQGVGRKVRVFVDYHQGFSYEGQFFNDRTRYGEVGFSWGF